MKQGWKRGLAWLLSLAVTLSLLPAAFAAEGSMNLLQDGSFESKTIWDDGNWSLEAENWEPKDGVTLNQLEGTASDGTTSMNFWTAAAQTFTISQKVTLAAGDYVLSADLQGAGCSPILYAGETTADPAVLSGYGTWDTGRLFFSVSEEKEYEVGIRIPCENEGWGYLDNMVLQAGRELSLPGGDLESGLEAWRLDGFTTGSDSAEGHTSNAVNLWISNDTSASGSASYGVELEPGVYAFSFELSGPGEDAGVLSYSISGAPEPVTGTCPATTGWGNYTTVETEPFTLPVAAKITFTVFSENQPAGYWGWMDNLELHGTGNVISTFQPEPEKTPEPIPDPVEAKIYVPYVAGTTDEDGFIRGADVSSLLSELNSGARFHDWDGKSLGDTVEMQGQNFMKLLHEAGVNWIRLRVWNDPFDAEGNGYGGGNNDVEAAKTIGRWATDAGMRVLIDFHYSDLWADPGKYKAPKAWEAMTAEEKAQAVSDFTTVSLNALLDAGVDVGMVQVGNETNGGIAGVAHGSDWKDSCRLFAAGCDAVHAVAEAHGTTIKAAVHFTNPEKQNYTDYAKHLKENGVDYDIFGSSYYAFFHGTTENLTSELKKIVTDYGKEVLVTENSWAWTLEDGDGHDNQVRKGQNDDTSTYPISVQGQALEFATVAQAVKNVGSEKALGLFYWENAWIPVHNVSGLTGSAYSSQVEENRKLWEQYGSGWASSYGGEYDPTDAGVWFGGSAMDNQAMFDFDGRPLESLNVFRYMQTGTSGYDMEIRSTDLPTELELEAGGTFEASLLPATAHITYTDSTTGTGTVTWNEADLRAVNTEKTGSYEVHGIVTGENTSLDVSITVLVTYPNLLKNPGFEDPDVSMYKPADWKGNQRQTENPHKGDYAYHFYSGDPIEKATVEQTAMLTPGTYVFTLYAQGGDMGENSTFAYVKNGGETLTDAFSLDGWKNWKTPEIRFTVTEETEVTVGVSISAGAGAWGTLDDWYLYRLPEAEPKPEPEPVPVPGGDSGSSSGGESSSGGGSSTGGSTTVKPDVTTDTNRTDTGTVTETTARPESSVQNGVASADVTASMGREIVEQAEKNQSNTVVVAPEMPANTQNAQVKIPADTIGAIADRTDAALRMETPAGNVTISREGLADLATEKKDVTAAVRREGDTLSVEVTVGSERTDSLRGGLKVETPVENAGPTTVAILVREDGTREVIRNSVASGNSGQIRISMTGSGTVQLVDNRKEFSDVPANSWYTEAVDFATSHEIMNGTGGGAFQPGTVTTRGMIVNLLYNLERNPEAGDAGFLDVPDGNWFTDAVAWASANGIVKGYGDGTFGPNDVITREQTAAILYGYAQYKGWDVSAQEDLSGFHDAGDISDWAQRAVAWACGSGLMNGTGGGALSPAGQATRAECAALLMRLLEAVA